MEIFIKEAFKTKAAFANAMGIRASDLSKYTGKGESVFSNYEKIQKLSNLGLNIDWYFTGNGEMLCQNQSVNCEQYLNEINELKSIISEMKSTIEGLRNENMQLKAKFEYADSLLKTSVTAQHREGELHPFAQSVDERQPITL